MTAAKPENAGPPSRNWVAFLLYLELSIGIFGLPVLGDLSGSYIGGGPDPASMMWFLVWWPHALVHRLNPLLADVVWSPSGFNLAWATTIPGPSLLVAPLTLAFGPVVSYNILCILAPALAAFGAYLLCRHITQAFWPSLIGGCIYGFSSYEVGHMLSGHLNLTLILVPPLCLYLVLLRLNNQMKPLVFVLLLALALCWQFLISTEIFATMTAFGAMTMLLACLFFSGEVRRRIWFTGLLIVGTYGLTALLLSPYLYHALASGVPDVFARGAGGGSFLSPQTFSCDLLHVVTPTSLTWVGHQSVASLTASFTGYSWEAGSYLGIPMIVLVALFALRFGSQAGARVLLTTLLFVWLASLGPVLHVVGRPVMAMPWKAALYLPLLNMALPARFMMYGFLDVAIIVAIWASSAKVGEFTKWGLVGLAMLFLLPAPEHLFSRSSVSTPAFFTDGSYRKYLAPGERVLVIPYGGKGESMLWQAQTDVYFRMVGGWTGMTPTEFRHWPIQYAFYRDTLIPEFGLQLKAFLAAHRVSKIVVVEHSKGPWERLSAILGVQGTRVGGVILYRIPPGSLARYERTTPLEMEERANEARFAALVAAADKYLAAGFNASHLSPARAAKLGLLPGDWIGDDDETDIEGQSATNDGLWLRASGDVVGVGVEGAYHGLRALVARYAPDAKTIYFPYPKRLIGGINDDDSGLLVITFGREGLHQASLRNGKIDPSAEASVHVGGTSAFAVKRLQP
jgi:hypothetical protein